jgi:uncharacterized radical SAM superfamily protein
MYQAPRPEDLWPLAARLKERGCRGLLLTGGCDPNGIVPLIGHCPTLARIKRELDFQIAVHSKLVSEPLADALVGSGVDAVMIDVIGSEETLREVHHIRRGTIDNVRRGIEWLAERDLPLAPHIVVGVHGGRMKGEYQALDLLEGKRLKSLVIVLLTALRSCGMQSASQLPMADVRAFFETARRRFADTSLLLGCARPMGRIQVEIDAMALEAGVDGIAYPSEGTVARARRMGMRPRFSEFCCALMV